MVQQTQDIKRVAVIGTGVIGASWAAISLLKDGKLAPLFRRRMPPNENAAFVCESAAG